MLKVSCCYEAKDGCAGKFNKCYCQNYHLYQLKTTLAVPIYQNYIFEYQQYILLHNSFCGAFHSWSKDIQNLPPAFPYIARIH